MMQDQTRIPYRISVYTARLAGVVMFLFLFSLSLSMVPNACLGNWLSDTFIDPADGHLDMSKWLLEQDGFMPVPILITEPAIGYGGGLALVYFHETIGSRKGIPPSVSAFAGAATENGTWFAGAGHKGIWKNDTLRYTGGLGKGLVKMDYYGRSGNLREFENRGIRFETDAVFFIQEIQARLWGSNFFAGLGYSLVDTANKFSRNAEELTPDRPGIEFDRCSASFNALLSYDSRDNIFTPSNGLASEVKAMFFDDAWGSDDAFQKYLASFLYYNPLTDNLVLGLRGDAKTIDGNAPFYAYPYIDMRGIKAMQYQGETTLLGELELRWSFTSRWALVGFGGAGKAFNEGKREDSDVIYSKGLGIRYLIASKLGLQAGIDVAQGPNDTAIYLQFGSSWAMK